jgi:hypothetical protein
MGKIASITTGVYGAHHSRVGTKRCYGSKLSKGGFIKVTIDLAKPMRKGDTVRYLLVSQRSGKIYNVVQRVRCGFRVKPTRFRLQRWSYLDETRFMKREITDIR